MAACSPHDTGHDNGSSKTGKESRIGRHAISLGSIFTASRSNTEQAILFFLPPFLSLPAVLSHHLGAEFSRCAIQDACKLALRCQAESRTPSQRQCCQPCRPWPFSNRQPFIYRAAWCLSLPVTLEAEAKKAPAELLLVHLTNTLGFNPVLY